MTTIDDRVAAGSAWLDANRPGWWQRINLDTLDLGDPCRCVLGQEYGDYFDAPNEAVGDIGDASIERGYDVLDEWSIPGRTEHTVSEELADLNAAWRTLIQARRNAEDPWAHWADEPDPDPDPAAWPDRTHDGQRMRDTDTADVDGEVL
jgi:hypothetical protein